MSKALVDYQEHTLRNLPRSSIECDDDVPPNVEM
jgi:hypothetical protein